MQCFTTVVIEKASCNRRVMLTKHAVQQLTSCMTAGWVCGRCAHSRPSCPAYKQKQAASRGIGQQRGTRL
jgi:hypothetical protein